MVSTLDVFGIKDRRHARNKGRIFLFFDTLHHCYMCLFWCHLGYSHPKQGVFQRRRGLFHVHTVVLSALRGKTDAASWFTSRNPLLSLKSLKTFSLSGKLLLCFPRISYLLFIHMFSFPFYVPASSSSPIIGQISVWSQRNKGSSVSGVICTGRNRRN